MFGGYAPKLGHSAHCRHIPEAAVCSALRSRFLASSHSGRGGDDVPLFFSSKLPYRSRADLALISAWPLAGAGSEGGDHRVAMSLAVQVDASATLIVGASPEGRPHASALTCETGVPSLAACRTVSEHKCRPGRRAAQGLDAPKKLLSWTGELLRCVDAELVRRARRVGPA